MMQVRDHTIALLFVLILSQQYVIGWDADTDTIPDIHFSVIRLNYLTYDIKGYYEFSQPYRKSLLEEDYVQLANIFYKVVPALDIGYIDIISRLTGKRIVHIETVFMGTNTIVFPPDSLFSDIFETGFSNPDPDTIITLFYHSPEQVDSAWTAIKGTDIIDRLIPHGNYEVLIFSLSYKAFTLEDDEWIIIIFTHPPTPDDIAFVKTLWPKTLITRNVSTIPEIVVHNFSDSVFEFDVQLSVTSSLGGIYESINKVGMVPSDSSRLVFFDPVKPNTLDLIKMNFCLLGPDGSLWNDAYPENDVLELEIEVIDQPVFRPISSIKHPGTIPVEGVAMDFDGDRYIDVFQYGSDPKLWQNNGVGEYIDITDHSDIELPRHPRIAVCRDFNRDGFPDILIAKNTPQFLLGNGTGRFEDYTVESGLFNITTHWEFEVFDKENDGDLDLLFESYEQETFMENDGSGHFMDVTALTGINDLNQTSDISSGDLNNDGFLDLVLTNWDNLPNVFTNNGDGFYTLLDGPWNFKYGRMSLMFDFDGDSFQDILFARERHDESILFRNNGNLTFTDVTSQVGGLPPSFYADAADLNGDGYIDVIFDHLESFTLLINNNGKLIDCTQLLVDMET